MMNKKNAGKVIAALLVLALALGVLFLGPLSEKPEQGPELQTPSMENIPEGTQLRLEVQPEEATDTE